MTTSARAVLQTAWASLGRDHAELALVQGAQHPVPLLGSTDVGALAWGSVAAASLAAARLAGADSVTLDPERVAVAFASERAFRIDGDRPDAFAPLSGFFRTADGWVRTHANYAWHADALRSTLGLPSAATKEDAAGAIARWTATALAKQVSSAGGICVDVRPEDRETDAALRAHPLVQVRRIGDARPIPLEAHAPERPLRGIRILDLTRVLAGPVATRTLALLGADVLRIDPPDRPEIAWQHLDTGHGKRSTLLDARTAQFDVLLTGADVVVLGYRPASVDALGLSPASLAARHPGVVVARLSAWGDPDRRGFDSTVQAASGISWIESRDGVTPGALPAQALDHSAGYLLAAAVMTLLARRAHEGGSWLAETSLRRICAELLGLPRATRRPVESEVDPARHVQEFDVAGLRVTTAAPAIAYAGGPVAFAAPRTWAQDAPHWDDREPR